MPRVPMPQGPQLAEAPLQGGYLNPVDVSAPARMAARGLGDLADTMAKFQERDDQEAAWRVQGEISKAWVDWNVKARENARGEGAKGYTKSVEDWWKTAAETYGKDLSPGARRLASRALLTAQTSAYSGAAEHENREAERARVEALDGALSGEVSRGAAGGAKAAAGAVASIQENLRTFAASTGKPVEWVQQQELKYTTALHANIIAGLMAGDPPAARAHFEMNKGQIDGQRHDEINKGLQTAERAGVAQQVGGELAGKYDFTQTGEAIKELDKRTDLAPDQKAAARQEIVARHAIQQSDADKRDSLLKGELHTMIATGMTQAAIMKTPQYAAVRDKGAVIDALQRRAEHQANLANAYESRNYTRVQRLRAEQEYQGAIKAMPYTDPTVLAGMPREKVAGLVLELGPENTQKLLAKWDHLKSSPESYKEAKIDQDSFNRSADSMGLDPYKADTEDKKRKLGIAKDRVESEIDRWQRANPGKVMPR